MSTRRARVDGWRRTARDGNGVIESGGTEQRWSLKRRKTARSDAVPEIYGSPDNEGGSSAMAALRRPAFCASCPHTRGAQSPIRDSAARKKGRERSINLITRLKPRMPKRDRRPVGIRKRRETRLSPEWLVSLVATLIFLDWTTDDWKIEDKDLYLHRYNSRSRNVT